MVSNKFAKEFIPSIWKETVLSKPFEEWIKFYSIHIYIQKRLRHVEFKIIGY